MQFIDPVYGVRDGDARVEAYSAALSLTFDVIKDVERGLGSTYALSDGWKLPISSTLSDDVAWRLWARDDDHFMAGRLSDGLRFWREIILPYARRSRHISDSILSWLCNGVSVNEFMTRYDGEFGGVTVRSSRPLRHIGSNHMSAVEHSEFVDETLEDYVRSGAVAKLTTAEMEDVVVCHPMGVHVQQSGKKRLILDARYLNLWQEPPKLEYDSLSGWRNAIGVDDFMFSLDHKSGYLNVPICADSYKYFVVSWKGEWYEFRVMMFGWSPACYVYQTLSTTLVSFLRGFGMNMIAYLDDYGASSPARLGEQMAKRIRFVVFASVYLAGYYTSKEKSKTALATEIELLGFTINSHNQCFSVPHKKMANLTTMMREVQASAMVNRTCMQSLAGKLQALSLVAPCMSIFTRSMFDAIQKADVMWNGRPGIPLVEVTDAVRSDLCTLMGMESWLPPAAWRKAMHIRMETDASMVRWGAVLYEPDAVRLVGQSFAGEERDLHINVKEQLAIVKGLEFFEDVIPRDTMLVVHLDNVVAQFAGLRGTSPDMVMRDLSRVLLSWQISRGVSIRLTRVSTNDNVLADDKSREGLKDSRRATGVARELALRDGQKPAYERLSLTEARERARRLWKPKPIAAGPLAVDTGDHRLAPRLFEKLQAACGVTFTLDACAGPVNAHADRYISLDYHYDDPRWVSADVLSYAFPRNSVGERDIVYCNPPWAILAPVWCHFRQRKCRGVLVFPDVPSYMWFPMVIAEAAYVGILASRGDADVFFQPSREYRASVGAVRWNVLYAVFDFERPVGYKSEVPRLW